MLTSKRRRRAALLGIAIRACFASPASARPLPPADLLLAHGKVYTVDAARPWAQSVAIKDGRIEAVGTDAALARLKGPRTRVIDLKGRLLLPAFGDAHVHPLFGGLSYSRCSLHGGKSVDDYRRIITACVASTPGNGTIYGAGWLDGLFPPSGVPDKAILDAISTARPLIFESTGGHTLWVNSKALAIAGITSATPDPRNGKIDRDPTTGEPNGGLEEAATELVRGQVPAPTEKDREDAIVYAVRTFNALGITTWQDALVEVGRDGSSPVLDAYKAVQDRGALTAHTTIDLKWDGAQSLEQLPVLFDAADRARSMGLTVNAVKFFLDGVIPQQTAAMLAPYEGSAERGELQIPVPVFTEAVRQVDAHGLQAHIHAIGDRATRVALDAFEASRKSNPGRDNRDMISHLNVIDPADQPRFGKLGVTAVFQPLWACNEPYMDLTKRRIGAVRSNYIYPDHGVAKAGGRIAYGSDWPVASADPLQGIEVALTRTEPGNHDRAPLLPGEAITLAEAVKSYTLDVAWVNHLEAETGSIAIGKSADLIVIDKNLFEMAVTGIHSAAVILTLFNGKIVFQRQNSI